MIDSKIVRVRGTLLGIAALSIPFAAVLSGCDQAGDQPDNGQTEMPDGEKVSVQTFEVPTPSESDAVGNRLPADASATARIPATDLFPGTAKIEISVKNPYSGDAEAIAAGRRHFAAFNCSGCHAPLGGGGMGPPLSDDTWIYGSAPAQIFLTILHGRPEGMPAFGAMLPEQTIWELVAYIDTLDQIEDYAAERDFDENSGGFRDTAPSD